jgi:hypothetical protein
VRQPLYGESSSSLSDVERRRYAGGTAHTNKASDADEGGEATLTARDEFSDRTKQVLAKRVNYHCSRPECNAATSGPEIDLQKALNVGVAAHIAAAAPGGPRYDPGMTPDERSNIENAIWLCQNCAKLVDNDAARFEARVLRDWKRQAEMSAFERIGKPTGSIEASELAEFQIVGRFGLVQTVYVSPAGLDDRYFVAQVLHAISSKVNRASILEILVFDDRKFVPQGLPMTDDQMKHWRARYNRNPNTGLDRFAWIRVEDATVSPPSLIETTDSIRPGYADDD